MSKTSYFNKTIYMKNLKRFWPIWAGYLVFWMMILPTQIISGIADNGDAVSVSRLVIGSTTFLAPAASFIVGIVAAMALFSYLYASKSAVALHALPLGRDCLFVSNYLSGLTFIMVPNLLVFLVAVLIQTSGGVLYLPALGQWLFTVCTTGFFFFSFAVFCAQFTGSLAALPLFYVIVNFLAAFLEDKFHSLLTILLYGYSSPSRIYTMPLSPMLQFLNMRMEHSGTAYARLTGTEPFPWYCLAAVVLTIGALILYRRRRIESAGDVISLSIIKPLFRWGLGLCVGALMSILLITDLLNLESSPLVFVYLLCFMLLWAAVGWYGGQMLIKKSFKVFRGSYKGLAIYLAAIAALLCLVEFDVLGIETNVPQADEVKSVTISGYETDSPEVIAQVIDFHTQVASAKDELSERTRNITGYRHLSYAGGEYEYNMTIYIDYVLNNGGVLERMYSIPVSDKDKDDPNSFAYKLDVVANSPQARLTRYLDSDFDVNNVTYVTMDLYSDHLENTVYGEDAVLIAQALVKDLEEGYLYSDWVFLADCQTYENILYIYMKPTADEVHSNEPGAENVWTFRLTDQCINTLAAMEETGLLDPQHTRLVPLPNN